MSADELDGSTPLDPEEEEDLIPGHITTLQELNDWEAANIARATVRAMRRKRSDVLTESFVRTLHLWMFSDTWRWAGSYRRTDKNIGSPHYRIAADVRETCANATTWVENQAWAFDEIAVRLHHRMVVVHPFPNGNGRHARLLADVFLFQKDLPALTWGSTKLTRAGAAREEYLAALKEADRGDFRRLLSVARS